jgi:hyperosmotically inducible periplasmic protein
MSTKKLLIAAITALGLLGALVSYAEEEKRSFGEYADDKIVLTKVKSALTSDKTTEAHEINIEVNKGIVQLNGFVDTAKEKDQATVVAKAVEGVKQVENNLIVKTESSSTGQSIDDSTVTSKVNTALIESKDTKAGDIKVATHNGVVQLSGFVDNEAQKTAAGKVAQSVKGVKSVKNDLHVKGT